MSKTAFVALILCCAIPTTPATFLQYIAALTIVGACAAIRFRDTRPHNCAIFIGLCFFAISIAYWWTKLWIGYVFHEPRPNTLPYFEDGMIAEGIIYPFVYFVFYAPVVAVVALFTSAVTIVIMGLSGCKSHPDSVVVALDAARETPSMGVVRW